MRGQKNKEDQKAEDVFILFARADQELNLRPLLAELLKFWCDYKVWF